MMWCGLRWLRRTGLLVLNESYLWWRRMEEAASKCLDIFNFDMIHCTTSDEVWLCNRSKILKFNLSKGSRLMKIELKMSQSTFQFVNGAIGEAWIWQFRSKWEFLMEQQMSFAFMSSLSSIWRFLSFFR